MLTRLRAVLAHTYGERLERVVLFGSRARGDFRPDPDYDIAMFIREPGAWIDEVVRLSDLGTDILMDTGAVMSVKPFRAGCYDDALPLMAEIRRDGRDL